MRKFIIAFIAATLATASAALAGSIASLAWNQSNIQTLRTFGKAAIVQFINQWGGSEGTPSAMRPQELWEFGWYDLAGDGNYELVERDSEGPCCVSLGIFSKDPAGKVSVQSLQNAGSFRDTVRDLNGDGKDELIIWTELAKPGSWIPDADTPRWPAVYRLKGGKYVEDSRDFPNYYNGEVLPRLEKRIDDLGIKTAAEVPNGSGGFSS
jgi:hypothetical protein